MKAPTPALPVVVIGAGPIGPTVAHLAERGLEPLLLEVGDSAGSAVRKWSHVRLLSSRAERLLARTRPSDRPERPLLRHGLPTRRQRTPRS
ncbi:hypothetical protein [Streptomyces sp. NPDC059176]|uniref:hypothetical protein n=1 Tax=unclassified Streptomyces TaxID=2593676 RepID=UPI003689F3A0